MAAPRNEVRARARHAIIPNCHSEPLVGDAKRRRERARNLLLLLTLAQSSKLLPTRMPEKFPITISATEDAAGKRLDQFLVSQLPDTSRARVQQLIQEEKILVNGISSKASFRLLGDESIEIIGEIHRPEMRAIAENIPLDVVYEDDDLAVVNKPAGMMVHAGAGATEDDRNRGTLVNALLHRFAGLSGVNGDLRPGIVHRLDKETSGLIIVAKNDSAHTKLAAQFSQRKVKKTYLALVHGWLKLDRGTINSAISRDRIKRTRMTTRGFAGREAITHYKVTQRIDSAYGKFTLVDVRIDTGRTHQIRVHMSSLGHPVVGDTLYGAPAEIRGRNKPTVALPRNFLHAAALQFQHPQSLADLSFSRPIPAALQGFLDQIDAP